MVALLVGSRGFTIPGFAGECFWNGTWRLQTELDPDAEESARPGLQQAVVDDPKEHGRDWWVEGAAVPLSHPGFSKPSHQAQEMAAPT